MCKTERFTPNSAQHPRKSMPLKRGHLHYKKNFLGLYLKFGMDILYFGDVDFKFQHV